MKLAIKLASISILLILGFWLIINCQKEQEPVTINQKVFTVEEKLN